MRSRKVYPRRITAAVARAASAAALETTLAILFALMNPFHIDEWAVGRDHQIWQRILADDYECLGSNSRPGVTPCPFGKPRNTLPPPIRVVYLDENSLDNRSHLADPASAKNPCRDY
jgi:hypothetical protein